MAYFISPIDGIPDILPGVGFGDDLSALGVALATILSNIDEEIVTTAKLKMKEWFGFLL